MKVRTLFIHPERGLQDAVIENAPSVQYVIDKLKEVGCAVLTAEEER